jgi:acyl-CoA reductase-like NAD-dependent aldehyde dehydrogenase
VPEAYKVFINGEWTDNLSGETFDVTNPANGEVVARAPLCSAEDVDVAVRAARAAAPGWAGKSVGGRSKVLLKLSQLILEHGEELAELETREHGSPLTQDQGLRRPPVRRAVRVPRRCCPRPGGRDAAGGVVGHVPPWRRSPR